MNIPAKPWTKKEPPGRILAIRLQAMGDLMITLPYLQALKDSLPTTRLDLLTRKEVDSIPRNIHLFDKIYSVGGGRNTKKIALGALLLLPALWLRRYDCIIDLQNNRITAPVRKVLQPAAWSAFDRFSPISAGERTRLTIAAAGLGDNRMACHFRLKDNSIGISLLKDQGWNGTDKLVILNPAGAFPTRNWPLANYIRFTTLWLHQFPDTRFVILGTGFIAQKAAALKMALGDHLIDLVGQTTPSEAFVILQKAALVLSEDSGLMHMAWVSGVPTMALFGGTRSDWARPMGDHSFFLDSSDLPCGNCMKDNCTYGDVHCLTRFTPEIVFNHATRLL